jgi:hypothetical protein
VYNPYLTIAGQTAPGGGIVIGGPSQKGEQIFISTHDVVIRYLTYDGYNPNTPTGPDTGTLCCEIASGGSNMYNVIFDHLSARWYGNKAFPMENNGDPTQGIHNVTYQWTMEYEPLITHPVGGFAPDATSGSSKLTTDIDVHHNMLAIMSHRLPFIQAGSNLRYVNNLNYNWDQFATLVEGGSKVDFIGNKYVDGNLSSTQVHVFLGNVGNDPRDPTDNCTGGPCDNAGPPSFYLLNNTGRTGTNPGAPMVTPTNVVNDAGQISMTARGWEGGETGDPNSSGPIPSSWFRSTPNPTEEFPITANDVDNLDNVLLPTVGNSQHLGCDGTWISNRDSEDARIITQYRNRSAGAWFTGQYSAPPIPAGTPCTESLHDGIPDQWKTQYGLSSTDPNLYKAIAPNGYTWLENYLNGQ